MFSEPVIGERFFGRGEVLELLNKRVGALKEGYRQNIALTGQSLAGKSSIILHFLHTIKEEGFVPIYVEVVKEPFVSFANKFIATMLYNTLNRMGEQPSIDLLSLLDRAQKLLPKTGLAIKAVNSYIDKEEFDNAYFNLLSLTSVLKDETGFPCIVILDEFDNLENLGIKNPFLSFGKVIMVQKDTMYIVSSSRNRAIKKIISEKLSLLFGNFEVVRISNFDLKTASDYLDARLAGFEIDSSFKKYLIAFTDGNPFYLERLTALVKAIAIERMSSFIDKDFLVEAIVELVYKANGAVHQYILNYILSLLDTKYKDLYLDILIAIAHGENKQAEVARSLKIKQGEIAKGLGHLLELGLVSKNGIFYKIDDCLVKFWLKFVYQRRKDLLIDGVFDRLSLFSDDIRSHINAYLQESERSSISRIAELFNLFSNELVEVESKNMRLPHFTKVEVKNSGDSRPFITASFRGNFWIIQPYESDLNENDVINYIKYVKSLGYKVSNKVIIPLKGIDENAKLIAKELKIAIWDRATINMLLGLYGKKGIILL